MWLASHCYWPALIWGGAGRARGVWRTGWESQRRTGVHVSIRPQFVTSEASHSARKAVGFTPHFYTPLQGTPCKPNLPTCKAVGLCMMARLPKLEQAANHKSILKRPEGPEAATSSLAGRLPSGVSPQEDRAPAWVHLSPAGHQTPRAVHQELTLFLPSVWVATSPGNHPPSPKDTGKEKSFCSPNVHVHTPREGF